MTFEKTLLKTIEEYEKLLQSGEASPERVLSIHQRMRPLQNRLRYYPENPNWVGEYSVIHPNSRVIRNEHSTSQIVVEDPNGKIDIQYGLEENKIIKVYLFALDFFFPRSDEKGEWWQSQKGHHRDFGYSETEFGYMHALRADGKGSFWSSEARELNPESASADFEKYIQICHEKELRKIKLKLWDTGLKDEAIRGVTFSRLSLEKGDLTAFFNHINYKLLDERYKLE